MTRLRALACLAALAVPAGGCASNEGDFPSLGERPAEREYAAEQMAPPAVRPPLPDDPALASRVAGFVAEAREASGGFSAAIGRAEAATGRAGAPGSDGWTIAQEEISRAISAQAPLTRVAGALDDYAAARARETPISPGDIARLNAAAAEVHAIAERQAERIRRLEASLSR